MLKLKSILILCQDDLMELPYHRVYPIIKALEPCCERMDILYYDRAYDRDVDSVAAKLAEGVKDFFVKPRLEIKRDGIKTWYGFRRLPLDGVLSTVSQDPWIYRQFAGMVDTVYDLAISEAPGPSRIALWLRNEGKVRKVVYDDTDYFPGFAQGIRAKAIQSQETEGVQSADKVFCVSQRLVKLREKQGAVEPVYLPNGVDWNLYGSLDFDTSPRSFTMVYVGSLEDWAGLDIFIQGMFRVIQQGKKMELKIIGDGPVRQKLETQSKELGLESCIEFMGRKSADEVPAFFKKADAGLVLPKPGLLWDYACPLKLFQYMAAGLPVLATSTGELGDLVKQYQCGLCVEYSPESVEQGLLEMLDSPDRCRNWGLQGKAAAENYRWDKLMDKMICEIKDMVDGHRD